MLEEPTSVLECMLMGRVREGARPLWLECSGDVSTILSYLIGNKYYISLSLYPPIFVSCGWCQLLVLLPVGIFTSFCSGCSLHPHAHAENTPEMVR
jgi:hypothetical protein